MTYCSTCGYPAPCGHCEDSDNPSARVRDYPGPARPMSGMCVCGHWDSLHHHGVGRQLPGCLAPASGPGQLRCRCGGFETA